MIIEELSNIGKDLIAKKGTTDIDFLLESWFMEGVYQTLNYLKNTWNDISFPPNTPRQVLLKSEDGACDIGAYINNKYITKLHNPIKWKEII